MFIEQHQNESTSINAITTERFTKLSNNENIHSAVAHVTTFAFVTDFVNFE
jgi:hypothetical protein